MATARRAVDSTLRKLLTYTAEIIMSIILLVIVCLPLVFTIPMWIQHVVFATPRSGFLLDPVALFGGDGALVVTIALALVSLILGYPYLMKMLPSTAEEEELVEEEAENEEEEEVMEAEVLEEDEVEEEISQLESEETEVVEDVPDDEDSDEPDAE
ncbi:MAG: hypothetical protein JSW61_09340 [Candidatus Thorarchaeota archaeon]|nr:MAG: hypothetical protein JSW61_09340 [Candidatus Thorarchaeota archaeon]